MKLYEIYRDNQMVYCESFTAKQALKELADLGFGDYEELLEIMDLDNLAGDWNDLDYDVYLVEVVR